MTLRHFQIFISVCDEQGMTQAARQLHISQPSISQAVKELEEHYQVRLFERLGKKLFLTPAGQELLHYARHIISLSAQTEKTLRSFSLAAPIRLGATLSIGESIFIDIITRLKKAMPEQEVYSHVHNTSALEDALLRDELDAALVEGSITSAYLTQIPFLEDELVFIIAPDQLPPAGFTMEQLADLPGYKSLVDLAFHRCGIPVYLSGTEDILGKSVISTVLSGLEAALGGFEQRAVLRYLRTVLSPLSPDTCDLVENYAVVWGIRGSRWLENWNGHPEGLSGIWTDSAETQLRLLNEARALAMAPLKRLAKAFGEARNLAGQVDAIYEYLQQLQLEQRLEELARELDSKGDNRSAQILSQLWEILIGALEQLYDVLGETVWDAESFTGLFQLLLSQYDVGTIPPVLDAVQVGAVSSQRLHQQKHLIVLGAKEGNLPGYTGTVGVLTDQERVALRALGVPLTGGNLEGIQAEFAEIYGVFCGATESVTVYASGEQPSYLFRRLAQMA
ncbi:MAG: LysR family transcriptional regulator, partial [Selenomonadaceae bacterium]|nr:LysR family transcriptional regulator [Selenomonadaceae bacterium]